MPSFPARLAAAVRSRKTPALVGLDPRAENLPPALRPGSNDPVAVADAYRRFCTVVVDVVAPLVPAVKPQLAFFEELGPPGMIVLAEVVRHGREQGLVTILDGKRGDIGSTAAGYAAAYLGASSAWGGDALTVNPYLGDDSLAPFVERCRAAEAGMFVLVKTSNPGGKTFQDRRIDDRPLYEHVAALVAQLAEATADETAGGYGAVGAVVGATYPQQLAELRTRMPRSWILVPGYGAQGGAAADVAGAFDEHGLGAIVNSSRGIIFAYEREPYRSRFGPARWEAAVEAATRDMIAELAEHTPAGRLGA